MTFSGKAWQSSDLMDALRLAVLSDGQSVIVVVLMQMLTFGSVGLMHLQHTACAAIGKIAPKISGIVTRTFLMYRLIVSPFAALLIRDILPT